MSSVSYGFIETSAPAQQRTVAIDFTFCTDDSALLGELFTLADRVKVANKTALVAKIARAESDWEQARVAARSARDDFQKHKLQELGVQNDVEGARSRVAAAYRLLQAWKDSPLDVFASKAERESHDATVREYQGKVAKAEADSITAGGMQNVYYATAQQLADDYNAKQIAFANIDGELKRLKIALENLESD